MNRRVVLLIIAVLGIGAWWVTASRNSWRYKMTVEVQTPEGVRSGYAVREVTYRPGGGFWIAEGRPTWLVRGQAVVVDLPNGKNLFALMRGAGGSDVRYGAHIADRIMGERGRVRGYPRPVELYPTAPPSAGVVDEDFLPMLVTFDDLKNSASVKAVEAQNLSAALGQGYALKRIEIGIVSEPVTTDIRRVLPWLSRSPEPSLKPGHSFVDPTLAAKLKHRDFAQGID